MVGARDTTPTCTPIILDGLAVKCVMWGSTSVFAAARCRVGMIVLAGVHSVGVGSARIHKQEHQTLTLGLEPTYHTLYLPMHIHTYTCPSNPKVGKCTR